MNGLLECSATLSKPRTLMSPKSHCALLPCRMSPIPQWDGMQTGWGQAKPDKTNVERRHFSDQEQVGQPSRMSPLQDLPYSNKISSKLPNLNIKISNNHPTGRSVTVRKSQLHNDNSICQYGSLATLAISIEFKTDKKLVW